MLKSILEAIIPPPSNDTIRARGKSPQTEITQYSKVNSLLTSAEIKFYRVLKKTVSDQISIQCKVRLADIFDAHHIADFNRISQKHIDFLLCDDENMKPLMGIELDDRSHQRPDRQERDYFLNTLFRELSFPLARIPVKREYNPEELKSTLRKFMQI